MWNVESLSIIFAAFLVAGLVKGVIGLGLPSVSLALMVATLGLHEAIALTVIPAFATNVWQGFSGGAIRLVLGRFWTYLLAACLGTWLGSELLADADPRPLKALLGTLLCTYSVFSLTVRQVPAPGRHEPWLSPLMGGIGGVLMGMTGSFAVPGVPYLQAIRLPSEVLIQAMGVVFTAVSVTFFVALSRHGLMTVELGTASTAALAPAILGMVAGRRIRRGLSEALFSRIFFISLFLIGAYIIIRSVV